jgi:hypothetical protein
MAWQRLCEPRPRDAEPNLDQRAKILSMDEWGITIEYSTWGTPIALRMAYAHCASMKKAAMPQADVMQTGPDRTLPGGVNKKFKVTTRVD